MKQRIITAIIAAALFIPFVIYGKVPFTLLVLAIAVVGFYEILKMKGISIFSIPGGIGLLTLVLLVIPNKWANDVLDVIGYPTILMVVYGLMILLLIYVVLVKNKMTFDEIGFILLGAFYVGMGFHYLIEIRGNGLEWVVYCLLVVWTTDSGAYFVGRKFGKNKLWPEISPKKTVEGFVGGIVIAVIFAVGMQMIYPLMNGYVSLILITIFASIIGQMGDLVESAIKRHYGVKDSGNILPGHGGILDRFDSLLFVVPLLHFLHLFSS
ncbi:phosphatidate cytidylyltransferase [Lysinibacillus contaminans]|uniref:Phosphatidate cytidylyltransferase n=1 Tax=Lysinibacillus contaminans TaxID=1293441 RepID=A0ABR5K448_9BACI|nr:phosphatidate cytidylyltransferase [Lysinibacillus contaminans]KOS69435.1 phosphatidate cytidylyltransferase [Lysinibacillus contaminans]